MFIKLCNLGRDAELRYTRDNKPVLGLALAYSVGYGQNKRTQWVDGTLWGERAEKLSPHLTKGTKILIHGDDLELETYPKNDGGQGAKIKCRIVNIEFAGVAQYQGGQGTPQQGAPAAQPQCAQQAPAQAQPRAAPAQNEPGGFDEFSDDIPF